MGRDITRQARSARRVVLGVAGRVTAATVRELRTAIRDAGAREEVRDIFALTMLDRVFALYPDVAAAEGS